MDTPAETELAAAKARLRAEMRARRAALSADEVTAASRAVAAHLDASGMVPADGLVLATIGHRNEIDLSEWLRARIARGGGVALPVVEEERVLSLWRVPSLDVLTPGAMGILEPIKSLCEQVAVADLAAVIVPGLAFDRAGHRLGQGGGYFDRLLSGLARGIPVLAVCHAWQLIEHVPTGAHDANIDAVISPAGWLACERG